MYINKNELPKFWKTQWFRLLFALAFFVIAIVILCKPADTETLEGLADTTADMFSAVCNILTGMFWVCSAVIEYNSDCIKALEKRVIQLEDRAITDIEEVEHNHFVAKRYCGPDKEEKPKTGSKVEKPKNTITVTVTKDGKTTETTYSAEDFDLHKIVEKAFD